MLSTLGKEVEFKMNLSSDLHILKKRHTHTFRWCKQIYKIHSAQWFGPCTTTSRAQGRMPGTNLMLAHKKSGPKG